MLPADWPRSRSHDIFALQFLWWKMLWNSSSYGCSTVHQSLQGSDGFLLDVGSVIYNTETARCIGIVSTREYCKYASGRQPGESTEARPFPPLIFLADQNWRWERPGNKAEVSVKSPLILTVCILYNNWACKAVLQKPGGTIPSWKSNPHNCLMEIYSQAFTVFDHLSPGRSGRQEVDTQRAVPVTLIHRLRPLNGNYNKITDTCDQISQAFFHQKGPSTKDVPMVQFAKVISVECQLILTASHKKRRGNKN